MPGHNIKADAVHNLICEMLRGRHTKDLSHEKLQDYIYHAGVALHNLPHILVGTSSIDGYLLREINDLDPSAVTGCWGNWVKDLASAFNYELAATL